jgi:hypothetical protein
MYKIVSVYRDGTSVLFVKLLSSELGIVACHNPLDLKTWAVSDSDKVRQTWQISNRRKKHVHISTGGNT